MNCRRKNRRLVGNISKAGTVATPSLFLFPRDLSDETWRLNGPAFSEPPANAEHKHVHAWVRLAEIRVRHVLKAGFQRQTVLQSPKDTAVGSKLKWDSKIRLAELIAGKNRRAAAAFYQQWKTVPSDFEGGANAADEGIITPAADPASGQVQPPLEVAATVAIPPTVRGHVPVHEPFGLAETITVLAFGKAASCARRFQLKSLSLRQDRSSQAQDNGQACTSNLHVFISPTRPFIPCAACPHATVSNPS